MARKKQLRGEKRAVGCAKDQDVTQSLFGAQPVVTERAASGLPWSAGRLIALGFRALDGR